MYLPKTLLWSTPAPPSTALPTSYRTASVAPLMHESPKAVQYMCLGYLVACDCVRGLVLCTTLGTWHRPHFVPRWAMRSPYLTILFASYPFVRRVDFRVDFLHFSRPLGVRLCSLPILPSLLSLPL